jgi:hypothetical protein
MTELDRLATQLREAEESCDQLIGFVESAQATAGDAVGVAGAWRHRTGEVEAALWVGTRADPYAAWR